MTDHHDDESWAPEDDELVRRALLYLMDDVAAEPLPEPSEVRARAESGAVVDLDSRRRRRRSMSLLAGAAAAALVATGAGLLVVNQSPDTPVATSTTPQPTGTSSGSTSVAPSRLTTLGPAEWQTFLGVPVDATEQGEPSTHCFRPADDTDWVSRSARQADGSRIAGQWVGTSAEGTGPLTRSVDRSVEDCDGYSRDRSMADTLSDGGTVRAWHASGPDGVTAWWVEVSDGDSVSFLSVPEAGDHTYTEDDIRTLALGVLGEADLTKPSATSTTTTPPSSTSTSSSASSSSSSASSSSPAPTSTSTSTSATTSTTGEPTKTTSSSSSTSGSSTTRPTPPANTPTPPDTSVPVVGPVPSSAFIPPARWSSQTLTGGEPAVGGRLKMEGDGIFIDECAGAGGAAQVGGLGIRSGPGDDNFFGRQFVLVSDSATAADQLRTNLIGQYSTDCSGTADTRTIGSGDRLAMFVLTEGDFKTYVAVVRQSPTTVTILHVNAAKTAPKPLTDATAAQELKRLAGHAGR